MDLSSPWVWLPASALALLASVAAWRWLGAIDPSTQARRARASFQLYRPQLELLFFQAAGSSGKPRGLRWEECQWSELVEFVRDKRTGQLLALVGVTISFQAIEGGDMEGIEAVGNLRNASAVFVFDDDWGTAGRVIFNLNPHEAVEHFRSSYERVD